MKEAAPPRGPDTVRANTAFALAMRIVGATFTGGLTLFLVRYLGPDDYGVYALAVSMGAVLLLPADFGVSRSAARFIAERRHNASQVADVVRRSLRLKLVGAGLSSVALFAAAKPIAVAYGVEALVWPLRIIALAVFAQSFMLLFTTTFEALGRNVLGFRLALSESFVEVSGSITLVLAGAGVTGAVVGRSIGYIFAALLGLALVLRALGRGLRAPAASDLTLRRIAGYAGALFVIDAAFSAFTYIDTLLIGAFLDARAVGLFNAPVQVLIFGQYAGLALAGGVAPRLARGRDAEPDVGALQGALRLIFAAQPILAVPIVVWATPITELLFGAGYGESADVFRALGPYVFMIGPVPLMALAVNYFGEARRRVPLAVGALAINAAIDAVLIPRIGIIAGAIGTDIAFLFFFVGHLVICHRLIGLHLRPLAATFGRASLAAAAMAGVLLAFGTSGLTAVEAVAGSALGLLAFAAVLLLTREFSRAELAAGAATLRGIPATLRGAAHPSGTGEGRS